MFNNQFPQTEKHDKKENISNLPIIYNLKKVKKNRKIKQKLNINDRNNKMIR
jgi:hypothetical protein